MKTSVIEVRDMLSVLSVLGVEERIGDVPGVESVTVNFAAQNATVRYDETRLDIADIRSDVRQSGYETSAGAAPAKLVSPAAGAAPAAAALGKGHDGHSSPDVSAPAAAAPKPAADAGAAAPAANAPDAAAPAKKAPDGKTARDKS